MRTTIDLPPAVHRRARQLAAESGRSLSAVVSDLAVRGMAQLEDPVSVVTDPMTGFPVVSIGRTVTQEQVAALIHED